MIRKGEEVKITKRPLRKKINEGMAQLEQLDYASLRVLQNNLTLACELEVFCVQELKRKQKRVRNALARSIREMRKQLRRYATHASLITDRDIDFLARYANYLHEEGLISGTEHAKSIFIVVAARTR